MNNDVVWGVKHRDSELLGKANAQIERDGEWLHPFGFRSSVVRREKLKIAKKRDRTREES